MLWWIAGIGVALFGAVVVAGAVVLVSGAPSSGFHLTMGTMLTSTGLFATRSVKTALEATTQR